MLRRAVADGHSVSSHTFSHPDLRKIALSQVYNELSQTDTEVVNNVCQRPTVLRPPFGSMSEGVVDLAIAMGKRVVLWNVRSSPCLRL